LRPNRTDPAESPTYPQSALHPQPDPTALTRGDRAQQRIDVDERPPIATSTRKSAPKTASTALLRKGLRTSCFVLWAISRRCGVGAAGGGAAASRRARAGGCTVGRSGVLRAARAVLRSADGSADDTDGDLPAVDVSDVPVPAGLPVAVSGGAGFDHVADRSRIDTTEGVRIWVGHGVWAHDLVKIGTLAA
jgi:hypothetical protein